jgi:hypothetical protein
MSAKTDFYAVLDAAAGLAALIVDRIYPDAIPEGVDMPALVYSTREEPELLLDGSPAATRTIFSASAWGATRTSADAVAAAARDALRAAGYPIITSGEGFDPEIGAFAATFETDDWR